MSQQNSPISNATMGLFKSQANGLQHKAQFWLEEHAEFVKTYNKILPAEGLPLEEWKTF
jgi:hypothetical protein